MDDLFLIRMLSEKCFVEHLSLLKHPHGGKRRVKNIGHRIIYAEHGNILGHPDIQRFEIPDHADGDDVGTGDDGGRKISAVLVDFLHSLHTGLGAEISLIDIGIRNLKSRCLHGIPVPLQSQLAVGVVFCISSHISDPSVAVTHEKFCDISGNSITVNGHCGELTIVSG